MEFEFFAWHTSITLKDDPLSQFKRKSGRCQPHLLVNWAGMTLMTIPLLSPLKHTENLLGYFHRWNPSL